MMTKYQHATVDGYKIFYREAGPKTAPTILLLHGFPTSSHMFRDLIPALADRYHVVAAAYLNCPEPKSGCKPHSSEWAAS
jgi:pimeloyl-ACP methyl ester carboxylesterase